MSPPRRRLLSWYRRHARPLPWRRDRDPYRVWVAETMLQQTTVAAVLPRYERFLRRFPDLPALARAPESAVLKEWAGLGYYARARNLAAAARMIAARPDGAWPRDMDSWLALPGIGRYTAAAVLSITWDLPHAVLDANVARILCRWHGIRRDPRRPAAQKRLWKLAQASLDPRHPGDWNQAMMELGETVCTSQKPICPACPWRASCWARKNDSQDRLPRLAPKQKTQELRWTCLWIERDGQALLWKRGPDELLLKGHWGLPEMGRVQARPGAVIKTVRHAITRYRIRLTLRRGQDLGPQPPQAKWVARPRVKRLLVSSLWLKALPKA